MKTGQEAQLPYTPRDDAVDELLSAAHRAQLVRLCAAATGDASAGEDLAQEALLEAWRHRAKLIDPAGADRWLAAIARNVCRRWLRQRSREAAVVAPADPEVEPVDLNTSSATDAYELREVLGVALATLPGVTREVVLEQYVEDASHAEIAPQFGLSAPAVAMRASRGRAALRDLLKPQLHEDANALGGQAPPPPGWSATRTLCAQCSKAALVMRHDRRVGAVCFRCPSCQPHANDLSHHFRLDVPVFARMLTDLSRPTDVLNRTSHWSWRYFQAAAETGEAACTRCGQPSTPRVVPGQDGRGSRSYVECLHCQLVVSTSAIGTALAAPAGRDFVRAHPRARVVSVQQVRHRGVAAERVVLGDHRGAAGLEVAVATDNLRFLQARTTSLADR